MGRCPDDRQQARYDRSAHRRRRRAKSFFIDPVTGTETAITGGLWRPVVDPTGRWDVAWEGTVKAGDTVPHGRSG